MFLSTKLALPRGVLRLGILSVALRRIPPIPKMAVPFATWVCQTVPRSFSSTSMAPIPTNRFSSLPAVTRDDVKRMPTAEMGLYLKARRLRGYGVSVIRSGNELDLSSCIRTCRTR